MRLLPALLLLLFCALPATGQDADADAAADAWPEAASADVESVDAIMTAVYEVISGPAGPRDWDRFRSLFHPEARLIPIAFNQQEQRIFPVFWTPGEYAEQAANWFNQSGFFEVEIFRKQERYGNLVHAFSTYESRRAEDDAEPFARGINSFQLLFDGSRWWVISIYWQSEWPGLPIPEAYLPQG